jgi:hypothetical protein
MIFSNYYDYFGVIINTKAKEEEEEEEWWKLKSKFHHAKILVIFKTIPKKRKPK